MKSFLKKPLFYAPVALLFIGFPVLIVLTKFLLERSLNQGVKYQQFLIKTRNLRIEPTLCLKSDGLKFESPTLRLTSNEFVIQLRPFSSPVLRTPLLSVRMDSLRAVFTKRTKKTPQKRQTKQRGFPNVTIPVLMSFRVNTAILSQPGDTQFVQFHGLNGRNFSRRHFDIRFSEVCLPANDIVRPGGLIQFRGSRRQVHLSALFHIGKDSLFLNYQPDLSDWQKFTGNLRLKAASINDFFPAMDFARFGNPHELELTLNLRRDTCWNASGLAQVQTGNWPLLPKSQLVLGPLKSEIGFSQQDGRLRVSLASNGKAGEEAFFTFSANSGNFLSFADAKNWLDSLTGEINGYTQNFRWPLSKRNLPMDFEVVDGKMTVEDFKGTVITSDGTVIHGEADWAETFRGTFQADLSPREQWALAWHRSEDRLHFDSAAISGTIEGPDIYLEVSLKKLQAYGAVADSAVIHGRILKRGYRQDSARFYLDNVCWKVHGEVNWGRGNENLSFIMENPQFGKAVYVMPAFDRISATVSRVNISKSLYKPLQPIFPYEPVVTGLFQWDLRNDVGKVDCQSDWRVIEKPIQIALTGDWTPEDFQIRRLDLTHTRQTLRLRGKVNLHGKPFYTIYKSRLPDIDSVWFVSKGIELSPWIRLLKDSLINRAELNGQMGYSSRSGLSGQLLLTGISFTGRDSLFRLRRLELKGFGSDVELKGRVHSVQTAFLNDSVSVRITKALSPLPSVRAHVTADKTLLADFAGTVQNWQKLSGKLHVYGGIDLSDAAGQIGAVEARADVTVPLATGLGEKLSVQGELKWAQYAYLDMEPIGVSSPFHLTPSGIEFPNVLLSSGAGQKMSGYGHYSFISRDKMVFHFSSPEMGLELPGGHILTLYNVKSDVQMDTDSLKVACLFKNGLYRSKGREYNVESEVLNTQFLFISEISGKQSLRRNSLGVNTALRDFVFRYRNLGWNQFQNLFKKRGRGGSKQKGRPMEVKLQVLTEGDSNRVDMDFARFNFEGEMNVSGTYPFLLVKGEFNSLNGKFGVTSQEYNLEDLALRWENEPFSEGAADMTAVKWLVSSCDALQSEEQCSVEINLAGKLNKLEFSYGGTCANELGETIDPVILLSSAGRGCYDPTLRGDIPIVMLEGQLSSLSSRQIRKWSKGWFERTNISGFSNFLNSNDEVNSNQEEQGAVALEIETTEWQRLRLRAKSGYIPGAKTPSPWEHEASVQWRPPLEHLSDNPSWNHRVKKRFMMDIQAKSTPLETDVLLNKHRDMQFQFGLNYNYEFWEIW